MSCAGYSMKRFRLMDRRARRLMVLAFFLLLAGVILPFLMAIRVLESTFTLNFLSYIVSVSGLFIGIIGIAMYVGDARNKDDWHDY